jgi:hypothetical protein
VHVVVGFVSVDVEVVVTTVVVVVSSRQPHHPGVLQVLVEVVVDTLVVVVVAVLFPSTNFQRKQSSQPSSKMHWGTSSYFSMISLITAWIL